MMTNLSRRNFLLSGSVAGLSVALPGVVQAGDEKFWNEPRRLILHRPQSNEWLSEVYWADGAINQDGYVKISYLLRDLNANSAVYMDLRLLDLLRAIQGYMLSYGWKTPLDILSGYRTASTNSRLEGAAKNSMHLQGKAIDFHMEGVPSNYAGLLASHFKGGGVGFYPSSNMTHIDTGSVRYWAGAPSKTIGLPIKR